jgi:Asp/Glu/hydantoin racemase
MIVALIHAAPASMPPAHGAFAERFPSARLWNLLDDRLLPDADAAGGLTPPLRHRMRTLIRHAVEGGADAVLLTCSMYGPVAVEEAAGHPVPVLPSDHALFDAVRSQGARRVAVLGPIRASVDDTAGRLRAQLPAATVAGTVVDGAPGADPARLERLVADTARRVAPDADVIVLGQFSIAPAQAAAQAAVSVPVLSPPHLAADLLRRRLAAKATA